MKSLQIIIITILFNITIASNNNYDELSLLSYKPLNVANSEISIQLISSNLATVFGIQWWVSDNLQLSGAISPQIDKEFNLYNNILIGYYNENIKWLYSSSNFFEVSLHKIKYTKKYPRRWINCAYKSRYKYQSVMLGYDINYYFWNDIEDNFISLIIGYNIKEKMIFEFKTNLINNIIYLQSFNLSVPL